MTFFFFFFFVLVLVLVLVYRQDSLSYIKSMCSWPEVCGRSLDGCSGIQLSERVGDAVALFGEIKRFWFYLCWRK